MLTIHINESDIDRANYERNSNSSVIIRKRFQTLWLLSQGFSRESAALIADVHLNSVNNFIKIYQSQGVEGLSVLKYKGTTSSLEADREILTEMFVEHPPRDSKEASEQVFQKVKKRLHPSSVRRFMHKINMSCRKTGHIPAKADLTKQETFLSTTLEPLLEKAQKGECHLFFMDAAHFVLGAFVGMIWCFKRMFVPSGAGRNRINVLGALNAVGLEVETIINTTYINAETIAEMLHLLAKKYTNAPIYIILDNARYQHCTYILDIAQKLGIQLMFLPPYSPNLNLIERLWKFVKKKVLATQYYDSAAKFHDAIRNGMTRVNNDEDWRAQLATLLKPKFQIFKQNLTL
jgi:transposase